MNSSSQDHDHTVSGGAGTPAPPIGEAVYPARSLDLAGRCCGRKPLVYKRPSLHYFCTRCDGEFGPDRRQQQNWAWKLRGDGFAATYPEQEAAQSVARLFALMNEYPAPADGASSRPPVNASQVPGMPPNPPSHPKEGEDHAV